MAHSVNVYKIEVTMKDKEGNEIASGETLAHTTEHHDDHGGTQSDSFLDHIHSIVMPAFHKAWEHAEDLNKMVVAYKSIQFVRREFSPYAKAAYQAFYTYYRRARRA